MSSYLKKSEAENFPKDWRLVALGDFAEILNSKRIPLSSEVRATMSGKYPYCGANGVVDYINDYKFDGEFVLMAEDGGNFFDYKTRPIAYLMQGKFWVNNHAHVLTAKNGLIKFLLYSLQHKDITKYIIGSTRTKLNRSVLETIQIAEPPFEEQKKIAEILSTVDEKIEVIEEKISKTQELKKGLMQQLFTKGLRHFNFKMTEVGEIPVEWEVKCIGDFVNDFRGGASLKPSDFVNQGGFPVIPKKSITAGGLLKIDEKNPTFCSIKFAENNKANIVDNTYLVTCLRDLVPSGPNIGYIVCFEKKESFILAQGVYGFKLNGNIDEQFLIQYSNTIQFRREMQKIMVGSTQVHIRNQDYLNVKVPIPSFNEQKEISLILKTLDERIIVLEKKKELFDILKKGLMQQLLLGKIRVNSLLEKEMIA